MEYIDNKTYLLTLNTIKINGSNVNKHIANKLIECLKNHNKLDKIHNLSQKLDVSMSSITKFVKVCGLLNFNELCYIHNNAIVEHNDKTEFSQLIVDVGDLITQSKKILFIGVSGSHISNLDFANKLMRLNKWVLTPQSKYDQIGLNNLLTVNDLLIVNSVSLQHKWIIEVIKNTKAKVLLISSLLPPEIIKKITIYWKLEEINDFSGGLRLYTTDSRIKILQFYILVFEYLIEDPKNLELLQISSYS